MILSCLSVWYVICLFALKEITKNRYKYWPERWAALLSSYDSAIAFYDLFLASLKLGKKSRRSVYPFKLRLHSFSWNRTIRSGTWLASALSAPLVHPLKCHALKRCTFWRETCLASAIALWLVNQRARASTRSAKIIVSLFLWKVLTFRYFSI